MRSRASALAIAYFLDSVGRPVRLPTPDVTPERIWDSPSGEIGRLLGLRPREVGLLSGFRREFSAPVAEARLRSTGVSFIARGEEAYPELLERTFDPPVGLFVHMSDGDRSRLKEILNRPRIAIVGARAASRYGIDAARMFASDLSKAGVCVVSGMALGIDAAAHRGAIEEEGSSIAVLGGGVDVVYPAANRRLYARLAASGAIFSEYPPGSRPRPWRFPARNRIIAGISRGVVVVEGCEGSGSLITADFCLEQGGEVFAVPGSIFSPLSEGPLRLINQGAACVAGAVQVMESLGLACDERNRLNLDEGRNIPGPDGGDGGTPPLTADEKALSQAMDGMPRSVDILARRAGVDSASAASALVTMELRGLVRYEPGLGYTR